MKKLTIEILVPDAFSNMLMDDLMESFVKSMDMHIVSDDPGLPICFFSAYEALLVNWGLTKTHEHEHKHYDKVLT